MAILEVLTRAASTGRLGPVFVGAAWDDVTRALGEAVDLGSFSRRRWPRLFAYGDLEIQVCGCRRVTLVCVQAWREEIELPPLLTGDDPVSPAGIAYDTVITALDEIGCHWEPEPQGTFGSQRTIVVTHTGAAFTFESCEDAGPWLNVLSLPGDGHECPPAAI
ncbi:hypothetical protein Afil01_31950 [Actinorhabdospora filicis]|uniref:Uncharacterized protein n=1 Tax=Actinorhabdospora filicis TaxID=1785913 RepID=A0A9W6SLW1_9ACTN|nr:hypothetical protein [Actinorhabdospora filicis]GLZ78388.1 hypothetical protein Afil01_31950 [Actinorhabdospora filicis]